MSHIPWKENENGDIPGDTGSGVYLSLYWPVCGQEMLPGVQLEGGIDMAGVVFCEAAMSLFSGSDTVSYGRVSSFLALLSVLSWAGYVVVKKEVIPDVPTNWFAIITFPYLITKTGQTIQKVFPKKGQ